MGMAGRGGLPQELNLRRGQAVGSALRIPHSAFRIVCTLQGQGFGGAGAAVSGSFLPRMRFTSPSLPGAGCKTITTRRNPGGGA